MPPPLPLLLKVEITNKRAASYIFHICYAFVLNSGYSDFILFRFLFCVLFVFTLVAFWFLCFWVGVVGNKK